MSKTHLIISPYWTENGSLVSVAEVVLTGEVEVSPLISYNATEYVLFASYTHADQTTENMYHPL